MVEFGEDADLAEGAFCIEGVLEGGVDLLQSIRLAILLVNNPPDMPVCS